MIANRRDFADVVARMRIEDIKLFHAHRTRWERRRVAWRHLKHNRAVLTFQQLLNSRRYTNPAERQERFEELQRQQQQRHEQERVPLIKSLAEIVPPKRLSSQAVRDVAARLETMDAKERAANKAEFEKLQEQQAHTVDAAKGELEALRAELHRFAALSPEGEFKPAAAAMRPLLQGCAPPATAPARGTP